MWPANEKKKENMYHLILLYETIFFHTMSYNFVHYAKKNKINSFLALSRIIVLINQAILCDYNCHKYKYSWYEYAS